jgi:hypothetical protein
VKRADQFQHRPARQSVSTRDSGRITRRGGSVNRAPGSSLSDVVEMAIVTRRILSVAVELTLMLPRSILEQFVDRVIERLDAHDGDLELELIDEREPDREI